VWPHALNPSHVRTTPQRWVRPKRQLPPGFIRPCQPILAAKVPAGDGWLHELKHDGYRIVALKDGERVVAHWPRGLRHTSSYSITSSARAKTLFGTLMPTLGAAFRLTRSSNLVGCSTGRSPGLATSQYPRNILGRPAKHVLAVRCDHENTASRYELAQSKYSRYSMLRRKLNKALPLGEKSNLEPQTCRQTDLSQLSQAPPRMLSAAC